MLSTSVSLLERLRQPGDAQAWSRFVHLYSGLLFHWARRLGLEEADAADLVQDVFALLVRQLPEFRYDPRQHFRAWLRTVFLNRWRELQRRRRPQLLDAEQLKDVADSAESLLPGEEEEYRHLLRQALAHLEHDKDFTPSTWQAFRQTAIEGRGAAEVAQDLGLTVNAVYIARFRVLQRLRQEFAGLLE